LIHSRITGNLASLEAAWERDRAEGSMRSDIRVLDLCLAVTAICASAISNRATLKVSPRVDLAAPEEFDFHQKRVGDTACAYATRAAMGGRTQLGLELSQPCRCPRFEANPQRTHGGSQLTPDKASVSWNRFHGSGSNPSSWEVRAG
jgi:hypothetical protein